MTTDIEVDYAVFSPLLIRPESIIQCNLAEIAEISCPAYKLTYNKYVNFDFLFFSAV